MSNKHKYILALDQGTTSSRAIIFDECGEIIGSAQAEFRQLYPREGWVEHDPHDILSSQLAVVDGALAQSKLTLGDIAGIGITNQRETTIVWDKSTGEPLYNAIVWQCRRTAKRCDELEAKGAGKLIYKKTGLTLDAYFSATKLEWILDNVDGARERAESGELLFGTVDTYLMWKLSGGAVFATDYTNASRTMLFNIHTLDWDDQLLDIFNIPRVMLPRVQSSGSVFGYTDETAFGARIPIAGVAGDQQAALFGQRCFEAGQCKNTFGTGCFLLMNTGDKAIESKRGLITTLAATADGSINYALEGSVFVGGAVVQWLRDAMQMISSAEETEAYASQVEDTLGVYIVPAFVGLGAPHWDAYARGTVTGLTGGTTKAHFIRAALESVVYQVFDVLHAMEKDCKTKVSRLAVDGGAAANDFMMQFMADIAGVDVVRPATVEVTALGVSRLAGITLGIIDGVQKTDNSATQCKKFTPAMDGERRNKLLDGWENAVLRTRRK